MISEFEAKVYGSKSLKITIPAATKAVQDLTNQDLVKVTIEKIKKE